MILAGAVLTASAVPLLLAMLAEITIGSTGIARSAEVAALSAWVFAFGFLILSVSLTATVAWRGPDHLDPSTVRFALDAAHLSLWGLSAGPAAVAVVATTAIARRRGLAPTWLVVLAGVKVGACTVEVCGIAVSKGWNAGGYASFSGGVALAAWLAGLTVLSTRERATAAC